MIDITANKCQHNNCDTTANFNYIGNKKGNFCSKHKLENMVDIKNKLCEHINCIKQPRYNYIGEKKRRFCNDHKFENMVNIASKLCEFEGCKLHPSFNFENEKISLFCNNHKLENMINILSPKCKTPLCNIKPSNQAYEGYCLNCFIHTFPDKPVARNYKTKETSVVDNIKKTFSTLNWTTDKRIQNGVSNRRPDLLLDLEYQILIVEIDENQHKDYDCSCENKRLMEISRDLNHRSIIFIRFNPDDYINSKGKKVKSCWTINKQGILVVPDENKKEWNNRLNELNEEIKYWIDPKNKIEKTIEIVELYYNQDVII